MLTVPRWVKARYDPKYQALKALEDRRIRELESRHDGERKMLEERIEHLETIVTSVDMEFNARLNRLMQAEEVRQLKEATGQMPQLTDAAGKPVAALGPSATAGMQHSPTLATPHGSPAQGGTPSAPPVATATLPPGSVFAERYKIHSMLGRGGMGVVYRAHDQQLDEDVAIKIANAEWGTDPSILDRLRREAAAARRIAHQNVIRVHDLGEHAGRLFISMEYFNGEQLSAVVDRDGPMATSRVRKIGLQVCEALASAHAAGVIHRDLKPQNVMIDGAERVKVIDFGIALAPHLHGLTATGLIMGTPEYMAPEQIRGDDIDARTDLYSMGCVLYYLLTGSAPFVADTPIAIGFAHLRKAPTPPSHVRTDVHRDWDAVCLRLLEKEKPDRYPSAGELRAALERLS